MMTMHRHFLGVLLLFLLPAPSWAESAAKALFVTGSPVVTAITGQVRPLLRGGELASGDSLNTAGLPMVHRCHWCLVASFE